MRYQLAEPWPIGSSLIPAGTIIDTAATDGWSMLAKAHEPPLNSVALDQEAYDLLWKIYGAGPHRERIHRPGPGVTPSPEVKP